MCHTRSSAARLKRVDGFLQLTVSDQGPAAKCKCYLLTGYWRLFPVIHPLKEMAATNSTARMKTRAQGKNVSHFFISASSKEAKSQLVSVAKRVFQLRNGRQ
jgi:hypothetical protein